MTEIDMTQFSDEEIENEIRRRGVLLTPNQLLAIKECCELRPLAPTMFEADHPDFGKIVLTDLRGEWFLARVHLSTDPTWIASGGSR